MREQDEALVRYPQLLFSAAECNPVLHKDVAYFLHVAPLMSACLKMPLISIHKIKFSLGDYK